MHSVFVIGAKIKVTNVFGVLENQQYYLTLKFQNGLVKTQIENLCPRWILPHGRHLSGYRQGLSVALNLSESSTEFKRLMVRYRQY